MVKVKFWTRDNGYYEESIVEIQQIPQQHDHINALILFKGVTEDDPMKMVRLIEWQPINGELIPHIWLYAPGVPSAEDKKLERERIIALIILGIILAIILFLTTLGAISLADKFKNNNSRCDTTDRSEQTLPQPIPNMVDTIGCNFNFPGFVISPTFISDKTFLTESKTPLVDTFGQSFKNVFSLSKIEEQKDTKRAPDPVNKDFFHKATF